MIPERGGMKKAGKATDPAVFHEPGDACDHLLGGQSAQLLTQVPIRLLCKRNPLLEQIQEGPICIVHFSHPTRNQSCTGTGSLRSSSVR